jgi:hypothetical protein
MEAAALNATRNAEPAPMPMDAQHANLDSSMERNAPNHARMDLMATQLATHANLATQLALPALANKSPNAQLAMKDTSWTAPPASQDARMENS